MIVKPFETVDFSVATPPVNRYVPVLPSSTVPVEAIHTWAELAVVITRISVSSSTVRCPNLNEVSLCTFFYRAMRCALLIKGRLLPGTIAIKTMPSHYPLNYECPILFRGSTLRFPTVPTIPHIRA